jgi:hypothetical protein
MKKVIFAVMVALTVIGGVAAGVVLGVTIDTILMPPAAAGGKQANGR